jgi:predicted nucleotidyltransferase
MRIVPFGSRARGKATTLSDFDFLIIIGKKPIGERMKITKAVQEAP